VTVGTTTLERVLSIACAAVAAWILAGLALISAVHLDDRYRISHVSGVWMALAQYVGDGTFYPSLYDGERFGGTRFMPLQFLLHGGLAEATGEYLISGKLLTLAVTVALLGLTFVALRRLGAPAWLGLALVALIVPTHTGLTAMTSIRGDALPAALQLGALLAVDRSTSRRAAVGAGLLCTAALLAKISALWAPAAIVVYLALRDRRRLATFLTAFAPATLGALVLLELVSAGRFSDNVVGLATSALEDPAGTAGAVTTKPLTLIDSDAAAISIVLPLALTDLVLAARARRLAIHHFAFVAALLVTLVVMVDVGAVSNHLLDLEILTVLLVGHLFAGQGRLANAAAVLAVLVPVAVVWAALTSYVVDMHGDVRTAARIAIGRGPSDAPEDSVAALVSASNSLLSEDPTIDVERGRHPTVLDPFMLLRIVREHPDWEAELVGRIDRREFDRVVLLADHVRPDASIEVSQLRWRREHFGTEIVAAIARNYHFRAFAGPYAVYVAR
jgi:hypothetical protein